MQQQRADRQKQNTLLTIQSEDHHHPSHPSWARDWIAAQSVADLLSSRDWIGRYMAELVVAAAAPAPAGRWGAAPPQELLERLKDYGQEGAFALWDELAPEERDFLVRDIQSIDLARIDRIVRCSLRSQGGPVPVVQPVPESSVATVDDRSPDDKERWWRRGLKAIAEGKLAVVLLAGGQGTRLGSSDPKGCFSIGLPSGKSLFQLQAERILRVQKLAAQSTDAPGNTPQIHWYIMTSPFTDETTRKFFESRRYFGLEPDQVTFFQQGTLPCVSPDGRFIMETPYKLARAPDGNGGVYAALKSKRLLDDMSARGVEYIDCYGVDNVLVRVADPTFLGYFIDKGVSAAAKVVRKDAASSNMIFVKGLNEQETLQLCSIADMKCADIKEKRQIAHFECEVSQSVRMGAESAVEKGLFLDDVPPVLNGVTLSVDGLPELVKYNFESCVGHQRLCCFLNGYYLDLSSFLGPGKVIFSTCADGTFYFTFTCTEEISHSESKNHKVTLVMDWRDGWNWGFTNKHGAFEYHHQCIPYMPCENCTMLEFPGDYSKDGIAPDGIDHNPMGLSAVREAVKALSEYNGSSPAPLSVRIGCGVLVGLGCESFKLPPALHWNSLSLLNNAIWTIGDCWPLVHMLRAWSATSEGLAKFFLSKMWNPNFDCEVKLRAIPGVKTWEDAIDMVAVIPKNKALPPRDNTRTWIWSPMDPGAGEPHPYSRLFLEKFPFNNQIAAMRNPERSMLLHWNESHSLKTRPVGFAAQATKFRPEFAVESIGCWLNRTSAIAAAQKVLKCMKK